MWELSDYKARNEVMCALRLTTLVLLVWFSAGCSRSQKYGASISAKDIAEALPEFVLVLPAGSTNVYLERVSRSPITMAYLKIKVPRASLTNFLMLSGLGGELLPVPAQALAIRSVPLPRGLDAGSAVNWLSDARHSDAWDLGKGTAPLLMTIVKTSAKSSPSEAAVLTVFVDDSTSRQAAVYFEYFRLPNRR